MALKSRTDLLTLDTTFMGEPFVQVAAKTGLSDDYTYLGEPFNYAVDPAATGVAWHYNGASGVGVMYGDLLLTEILLQ